MDYQIWIAFSDVMLLVFQLNHFLAFVSDLGESKPDLHSTVIHILRKSRTQGLVNIFSNFSNCGCLVGHSRLTCGWSHFIAGQRRSISCMIRSAHWIASSIDRCRDSRSSIVLRELPRCKDAGGNQQNAL